MVIAFQGYAIVSADGFIADERGRLPDALRFDADWAYFQAALDDADVTLLGRRTHDAAANVKGRRRIVVSSGVRGVVREDDRTWWANPEDVTPTSTIVAVAGPGAHVAVVGGTGVYDWILEENAYHAFHLSLARDVRLGAGRPLFTGAADLDDAIARLTTSGLDAVERSRLDDDQGLDLLIFRRQAAAVGTIRPRTRS